MGGWGEGGRRVGAVLYGALLVGGGLVGGGQVWIVGGWWSEGFASRCWVEGGGSGGF